MQISLSLTAGSVLTYKTPMKKRTFLAGIDSYNLKILKDLNQTKVDKRLPKIKKIGVDKYTDAILFKGKDNQEQRFFDYIMTGNHVMVSHMISAGLGNQMNIEALTCAISFSASVVDELILRGAKTEGLPKIDDMGLHLWYKACLIGSYNLVKELLQNESISVHHSDEYGNTPLKVACQNLNVNLVELLLEHGAKPSPELILLVFNVKETTAYDRLLAKQIVNLLRKYHASPEGKFE